MWPPSSICPFSSGPFSEWRRPWPKAVVPRVCLLSHPSLGPSAPQGGGPPRQPVVRPEAQSPALQPGCLPRPSQWSLEHSISSAFGCIKNAVHLKATGEFSVS